MIRYARLGYLALNVSDLDRSEAFYRDTVGLESVPEPDRSMRMLRCSDKHHDLVLHQGEPGLKRVGFELESSEQIGALQSALRGAGREFEEIPAADRAAMHTGPGLRTWEPVTGCTIDFYVRAQEASLSPYVPSVVSIERLGHLVLRSADAPSTLKYFTEVLNFQESDAIVEAVTFLRCFPNPLHHSLGVGTGKGRSGLHHLSFMVSDMDAIGSSVWRFQKLGVPIVNGPGRHLPSGSVFLYFLDPDGLTVEYSFGMEEFPEVDARAPRRLPRVPLSFDLWDGPVDPRKAQVGVIEQSKKRVQAANQI